MKLKPTYTIWVGFLKEPTEAEINEELQNFEAKAAWLYEDKFGTKELRKTKTDNHKLIRRVTLN